LKAIRFHETGGPEVLRYEDVPDPTPGGGEVCVKLDAIGVNFVDTYQRAGAYPVPLPHTAGGEGAGAVAAVGTGVTDFAVGDRVAFSAAGGSYAEYVPIPAARLFRVPDGTPTKTAAAVVLQGMTAHFLAHSAYALQEGDTCLIHAGAGGVGLLLTQMAKMRGATVIATVSTEAKADLSRAAGADHVILYTQQDFVAEVDRIMNGEKLPVVYDSVGKTTFDGSIDCLGPRGVMVLYGQSSGAVPPVDPQLLNRKGSLFLTRPTMGDYIRTAEERDWRSGDIFRWAASGELAVRIGLELALAEAAEAHRALAARETTGKVILIP
jgi:NADPH2:quinone reductase